MAEDNIKKVEEICGGLRRKANENPAEDAGSKKPKRQKVYVRRPIMSRDTNRFLAYMKKEAEFLQKILSIDRTLLNGDDIHEDVEYTLSHIDSRNKFWLQDIPYHIIEKTVRLESRPAGALMSPRPPSNLSTHSDPGAAMSKWSVLELARINELFEERKFDDVITRGKSLVEKLAVLPPGEVEMRPNITCNTCSVIGNSYLEKNDTDRALAYHTEDLEMASTYDLPEAKSRAIDNVGRTYARRGEYEKAIAVWLEKMAMPTGPAERAWLCHEIGYCYLELDHVEEATSYGEVTVDNGITADDRKWQQNGYVLLAQSHLKGGDYVKAFNSFQEALIISIAEGDKVAEEKIREAMEELNNVLVDTLNMDRLEIKAATPPQHEVQPEEVTQQSRNSELEEEGSKEENFEVHENYSDTKKVDSEAMLAVPDKDVMTLSDQSGGSSRESERQKPDMGASYLKLRRQQRYGDNLSHLKNMNRKPSIANVSSYINERRNTVFVKTSEVQLSRRESEIIDGTRQLEKELSEKVRDSGENIPNVMVKGVCMQNLAEAVKYNVPSVRSKKAIDIVKPPRFVNKVPVRMSQEKYSSQRIFLEKERWRESLH